LLRFEWEWGIDADESASDESVTQNGGAHKPQKRRPRLPPNLPRKEVIVRLPPEEQVCDCCHQPMHVMGEEVREELELIPAHVQVTRYIRNEAAWRLQIEVWQNSVILNPVSRRLSRAPFP